MTLTPGTRIGPYEVTGTLGAGGMGEVYRARDPRLQRDVAVKTSLQRFNERFDREARAIAALNHPNICQVYDVGPDYLVMELVEGDAPKGPLPLDEVLNLAEQIAAALDAAHAKGITHRDLKPGNIRVTPAGVVKVLDFGLAKFGGTAPTAPSDESPTISMAATQAGMILGTAAYMAPEQARGKPVDHRADIWAFGVVVYELLTGERLFKGDDLTETLASVVKDKPDLLRVPRRVRRMLGACLEKDPAKRLQAIGDWRHLLDPDAAEAGPDSISKATRRNALAWPAVAAVLAIVSGAGAWFAAHATTPAPVSADVTRSLIAVNPFDMRPPAAPGETRTPLPRPDRTAITLSPDGRTLVFRGATGTAAADARLYRRQIDSLDATPIDGTDSAETVFFSPDGKWIGFVSATEIKKVPFGGGPASTVAKIPGGGQRTYGISWGDGGPDGVIVFSTLEGVWSVSGAGGAPTARVEPGPTDYAYKLPSLLPGGDALLITIQRESFEWEGAQVAVRSLSTGNQKVLLADGADARYASSGHLLFVRRGVLMAAPFDVTRLEVKGGAVAVLDGVMHAINNGGARNDSGAAQYAIANDGTLVYADSGTPAPALRPLTWVTRAGATERLMAPEDTYLAPRLAPGERRVAAFSTGTRRVWLHDVDRSGRSPLTAPTERGSFNVWSPDGRTIAMYSAVGGGSNNLFSRATDGTGNMERLTTSLNNQTPSDWAPDGTVLAFVEISPVTTADIWLLDVKDPKHGTRAWLQTKASERFPTFSPDGRWLAYSSDESGRDEVYVQPFPGPGPRVQISSDGGDSPAWRGDGAEMFYLSLAAASTQPSIMAVPVKAAKDRLVVGRPLKLFDVSAFGRASPSRGYDVTRDGQRFVMAETLAAPPAPPSNMVLVTHFLDELRRRVPVR